MTNFNWKSLLNEERLVPMKKELDDESNFDNDYKRIITSPAFRRLQDKTQVFPLERNDFVRTRLTHSIEVSSIAREIATKICLYYKEKKTGNVIDQELINNKDNICRVLECAALLHDIGNPPFGHFGADIIREWFRNNKDKFKDKLTESELNDFLEFEGNAQALRIITRLHDFAGDTGMNLTLSTLNVIIKYTRSSSTSKTQKLVDKKIGYFQSEREYFNKITSSTGVNQARHPLTFILEAADDIAYLTADIEDALKKQVVSFESLKEYLRKFENDYSEKLDSLSQQEIDRRLKHLKEVNKKLNGAVNQNILFYTIREKLIAASRFSFTSNYIKIMNGEYDKDLFGETHSEALYKALSSFAIKNIFNNKDILKIEVSGHTILSFLLDKFINAILEEESDNKLHKKLRALISDSHKKVYENHVRKHDNKHSLYHRILMVTDFISGMTDSYAHDLYIILSGNKM